MMPMRVTRALSRMVVTDLYAEAMALYAAYGGNMDPSRMAQRAPHSPPRGSGWLQGWRLTFGGEDIGWDGALATLVEDHLSQVFVMLYDLTESDERSLDEWEGSDLGLYRKIRVRVQTLDGEQLAWMYVLDAYEGGLPSASYIGLLAEAAQAAGAPDDYVADLLARPCRSIG
jgi:AIG2-like family